MSTDAEMMARLELFPNDPLSSWAAKRIRTLESSIEKMKQARELSVKASDTLLQESLAHQEHIKSLEQQLVALTPVPPVVVQWDSNFAHEWVYWFGTPSDDLRMDFHIPAGSLQQHFSIE